MRGSVALCLVLLTSCGGSDADPGLAGGDAAADGAHADGGITPADGALTPADGASGGDVGPEVTPNPVPPAIAALCASKIAPITVPGTNRCLGDLAKATFLFAECACTDITVAGSAFNIEGINSGTNASGLLAAVGANGRVTTPGSGGNIKGSVWAAGVGAAGQPTLDLSVGVDGSLHCGGNLTSTGILNVAHDAYVTGATSASSGVINITGALHQPASSPAPTGQVTVTGGVKTEPVTVVEPCNCSNPLPIASIVAATKTDNDDAALGLTPASLSGIDTKTLDLGCGRFYFDAIKATRLSIRVYGPTAIFIAGNVEGTLSLQVEPGGQIDMFVGGDVRLDGAWSFGSSQAPANSRIYIAGSTVSLAGAFNIDGNLYAPNASFLVKESAFQVRGSLYARAISVTGSSHHVAYDQRVQELTGCQPPSGGCTSCRDCAGATPACKGGTCAKCVTDSDCCAPLACQPDGTCKQGIR